MYISTLTFYTESIIGLMEVFMVPRLINNLEESTKTQVIWINDAVNISQYRHIDKVIFLGLHPLNKSPYLLNFAASEANMELNFEIATVWGCFKDWVHREKMALDQAAMNDKISGNYILQFNKNYELVYINEYDRQELSPFFTFPPHLKATEELRLDKILKHKVLWESLNGIVTGLVESGEREAEMSKPHINIRVALDGKNRLKNFILIFRNSLMQHFRFNDPFADFEYAVTPMSVIKHEENGLNDSLGENNQSVYSNRESIFSGIKRKVYVHKEPAPKKSGFGKAPHEGKSQDPSPRKLASKHNMDSADSNPRKLQAQLQKQNSRFTIEGSLFSEGPVSIQAAARGNRYNNAKLGLQIARPRMNVRVDESPLLEEESMAKYRRIQERVNKSIVMEYMQPEPKVPFALTQMNSSSSQRSHDILAELDGKADTGDQFVKDMLAKKKKSRHA